MAAGQSWTKNKDEWKNWIIQKVVWFNVTIHAEFEVMGDYNDDWLINIDQIDKCYKESPESIADWKFDSNGPRTFENELKK